MSEAPIPNTTPEEQFKDEVLSCCRAYMADKNSQWKARCAMYMLAHFAEHVWYYYTYHEDEKTVGGRKKAETFIRYLAKKYQCAELEMVWGTAVVSKHRFPLKPDKLRNINKGPGIYVEKSQTPDWPTATGTFSPEIAVGSTDAFSPGIAVSSTGSILPEDDTDGLRMTQYDRRVDDVLKKVVDFWTEWLKTAPTHS